MRILVVDDSKAMRMIVMRELRGAGYGDDVLEADTGRSALERIAEGGVDLVISDWNMPEMSGIEFLKALREQGWHGPFGFVTTESASSAYEQAMALGASFLMGKPFSGEVLIEHIERSVGAAAGS